jgi:hypothetical protein
MATRDRDGTRQVPEGEGVIVGTAAGAVAGGLGGRSAAEAVNPTLEDGYWRDAYRRRPYAASGLAYEQYRPAYKFGWEARLLYRDLRWDEVEGELAKSWHERRGSSTLTWEQARDAAHDAWHRLSHRTEDAWEDPVLDLETSESDLDRPDRRLEAADASAAPAAGADLPRKGETLH